MLLIWDENTNQVYIMEELKMITQSYELAKQQYAAIGIDTDAAMEKLAKLPISMHCWQGDDVAGFEITGGGAGGGTMVTGNYPGKARTPEELMADIDKTFSLIPGKHRLNLHASYAITDGENVDRDKLEPKHFAAWVEFAKSRGIGLDFNPTYHAHSKSDNGTLSAENEETRKFWIDHGKACIRIAEYFADELGTPCCLNIWIPDGFKNVPSDRYSPRARLKDSLDQILGIDYDKSKVIITLESKVFGIGLEACTVGSHEFYMNYAAKNNALCLLDNGHFHPTEMVSDKISSMLLFADKVALHVTRPMRWDSDHVVLFDDETRAIADEIVKCGTEKVILALDFFDASINRTAAWAIGSRNALKAILVSLLEPTAKLKEYEQAGDYGSRLALAEEIKSLPFGAVWDMYCETQGVPVRDGWIGMMKEYERNVLLKR